MKYLHIICFLLTIQLQAQNLDQVTDYMQHGRYVTAEEKLLSVLTQDSTNAAAWVLLTDASIQEGDLNEATTRLTMIPAQITSNPLILCSKGTLLLMNNNIDSANLYFNKALQISNQKDPDIIFRIAEANYKAKKGNPNYGLQLLNLGLRKAKNKIAYYLLMGDLYRKLLNGTEAYKAYQLVLNIDPKNPVALFKIGKIFEAQENKEMYLSYYERAFASDSLYSPAIYELYYYYYFRDINKAKEYLFKYLAASDSSLQNEYLLTDMLYATGQYTASISHANRLLERGGITLHPRLYKLKAYSYWELKAIDSALANIQQYIKRVPDSTITYNDYEMTAKIYDTIAGKSDSAYIYYCKALEQEKNGSAIIEGYKKMADYSKKLKYYDKQTFWLGKYYSEKLNPSNIDLFNWGIAAYMSKSYTTSDSIFNVYETKYPKEEFGYYWSARSGSAIDTAMEQGLAIKHYLGLLALNADSTVHISKKHLVEAYGYLAAYKANKEKNLEESIGYFEKLLELDPLNNDAKRYIEILRKHKSGKKDQVKKE